MCTGTKRRVASIIAVLGACFLLGSLIVAPGAAADESIEIDNVTVEPETVVETHDGVLYFWQSESQTLEVTVSTPNTEGTGHYEFCVETRTHQNDTNATIACRSEVLSGNETTAIAFEFDQWPADAVGRQSVDVVVRPNTLDGRIIANETIDVHVLEKSGEEGSISQLFDALLWTNAFDRSGDGGDREDGAGWLAGFSPPSGGVPFAVVGVVLAVTATVRIVAGIVAVCWIALVYRRRNPLPGLDSAPRTTDEPSSVRSDGNGSTGDGTVVATPRRAAGNVGSTIGGDIPLSNEERILAVLSDNDGRMRQSDIVDETGWSKSKVSRVLSEMEADGEISKIDIGRGNIITIPGHEPERANSPFEDA